MSPWSGLLYFTVVIGPNPKLFKTYIRKTLEWNSGKNKNQNFSGDIISSDSYRIILKLHYWVTT